MSNSLFLKKSLALFFLFLITKARSQYSGGNGSESSPYLISSFNDLRTLSTDVDNFDKFFKQTIDIDASGSTQLNSGAGFLPIGSQSFKFRGTYDGGNFKIENLVVNRSSTAYQGLFGFISNAKISKIKLINVTISGGPNTGGIVGWIEGNSSSINNCQVSGAVTSSGDNCGGLVGNNNSQSLISFCSSSAIVSAGEYVGGLIGITSGSVTDSYSTGNVLSCSACRFVGGLIGSKTNGNFEVKNSYASGNVSAGYYIGGLIGINGTGGVVDCYSTGSVSGCSVCNGPATGGLIGTNSGPITNSYATGNILSAQRFVGGLIGENGGTISKCYATGNLTPSGSFVGGLIGTNTGSVTDSYATGSINAAAILGGLIGKNTANVTNSYATGSVTGNNFGDNVGGFIGENTGAVSLCFSIGNITSLRTNVGGFVGLNSSTGSISNSYSGGNVSGVTNTGGFAGESANKISFCFSKGTVSGQNETGAFIGLNSGSVQSGFYNQESTGQLPKVGFGFTSGISGLNASDFNGTTSLSKLNGFDFCQYWIQYSGYPILYWQDKTINLSIAAPTVNNTGICIGQTAAPLTATADQGNVLLWYGTSASGGTSTVTAPVPGTSSATVTDYYVSQKNPITGCESARAKISVTVTARPATPTIQDVSTCSAAGNLTLTATPSSGSSLVWYGNNETGGQAAESAPVAALDVSGVFAFYVAQKVITSGCESERVKLTLTVKETPGAPTVSDLSLCSGVTAVALSATANTGNQLLCYGTASTGGTSTSTAPTPTTTSETDVNYYVSQKSSSNNCESTRARIRFVVNKTPEVPTVADKAFCKDDPSAQLNVQPAANLSILWYGTNATGGTGSAEAPTPSTSIVGEQKFYLSQLNSATGCTSPRALITVKVNDLPSAPQVQDVSYCLGQPPKLLTAIATAPNILLWYGNDALGGNASTTATLPDITSTGSVAYYVAQKNTSTGCESSRSKINVIVNNLPAIPEAIKSYTYCSGEKSTSLSAVAVSGNGLVWYENNLPNSIGSSNAPVPATNLPGNFLFFVAQKNTTTQCESAKVQVEVLVKKSPDKPIISADGLGTEGVTLSSSKEISYQWFFNGQLLNGKINQTLEISELGAYKVVVTKDGCSSQSDDFVLTITGILKERELLTIYPNPAAQSIRINCSDLSVLKFKVSIMDSKGSLVLSMPINTNGREINIEGLPSGVYFLKLEGENYLQTRRLIVKR